MFCPVCERPNEYKAEGAHTFSVFCRWHVNKERSSTDDENTDRNVAGYMMSCFFMFCPVCERPGMNITKSK